MDPFVVSARKYRPQTFRTVVGQQHVTNTLKNAILNKHLAQAFLFCGPRGVGKTTCARILAKTINCFSITTEGEACDTCESCSSFNSGQSLNVFELDAASNNSVDDIRSLIEQVRFAPQLGDFKVYIIDEVHMLSAAAFNAFLKTLEEPPKHAVFILATTEKHKVLPTILSRCQIFDFNRIKTEDISGHLRYIADTESVSAETDALHIIAQKADGGLRDACSIFDQMVSFTQGSLTYKAVIENLHVLDYDYYFNLIDSMYAQKLSEALLIYDQILKNGFDSQNFIVGLGEHFRNLLVCKDPLTLQLLDVSQNIKEKYLNQSGACNLQFILKSLAIINRCDVSYKTAKNQRLHVEMALIQISYLTTAQNDAEKKNDSLNLTSVPNSQKVSSNTSSASSTLSDTLNQSNRVKVTEKPVTSLKDLDLKNSFSINQIRRQQIENAPTTNSLTPQEIISEKENTVLENLFSEEDLRDLVKKFADGKLEQGQKQAQIILSTHPIKLKDNFVAELTIENEVQKELFMEFKQELLDFLRKELVNSKIQFDLTELIDNPNQKAYTPSEKFELLKKKNPLLADLKKKLDMEFDY